MSRAMASSYVAQLEKHLGTRLLHRTTRKVSVSPQGAVYLEHCKRILAEIDAADDQLRLARDRPQGKLRVDVPVAFGKYLLLPAIPQFTAALSRTSRSKCASTIATSTSQAEQRRRGGARRQGEHRRTSSRKRICGLAPASPAPRRTTWRRPACRARPRNCASIASSATCAATASRPAEWQFKQGNGTRSLRLPMALSFNTVDALSISALEGQGIVQQLDLLVGGYLTEGRLVEVLREYSCEGPPLSVIYPRATQHLAKVRVFAEFAADLMRNYEARMRRKAEPASR